MVIRMTALLFYMETQKYKVWGPTKVPGLQVAAVSRARILCCSPTDIYQLSARKLLFLLAMAFGLIKASKAINSG